MSNPAACAVCQERDHKSAHCPELTKELQPGFYKPAGGMPRGGDDEDDSLDCNRFSPLPGVFVQQDTRCNRNIQRSKNPILANRDNRCMKGL